MPTVLARSRHPRAIAVLGVLGVMAVLVLLRLPSLFEPAWSADEGAYANIGRSLDLGGVLYSGVWDNKPPGIYWVSAAATAGGASVLRMQLALFVIVLATTVLTGVLAFRLAGVRAGLLAALLFAVVASVPNFGGDQLNAEVGGAMWVAAAMLVLLWRLPVSRLRAVAAGVLLGFALLFKATFAFDVLAAPAVPLLLAVARSPAVSWRRALTTVALMGAGVVALCGAAIAVLWLRGSLPAFIEVLAHHDPRYAAWGITAGPDGTPSPSFDASPSALLRGIAVSRLLLVLAVGAAVAVALARRSQAWLAVVLFWLSCDLAAAMVDNRALTHYVQQAEVSLAVAAALLVALALQGRRTLGRLLAVASLPAIWVVLLGALFIPRASAAVATGPPLPQLTRENASGRSLPGYYRNALDLFTRRMSLDAYHATFAGANYPQDVAVANLLAAHSSPGERVFVWGDASPWVYAFADRLPAARFIWMGSAYRLYPQGESLLLSDLTRTPPAALIALQAPSAALADLLNRRGYRQQATPYGTLWIRAAQPLP
jgi:hypothetical protein